MIKWQIADKTIVSDLYKVERIHTGELWLTNGGIIDFNDNPLIKHWTEQNAMIYDAEDYPMIIRVDRFKDSQAHISILETGVGNNQYIINPKNPKEIKRGFNNDF